MIEFIKGSIDTLTPAAVVVETRAGVGYLLNISLQVYTSLQSKGQGAEVRMLVHEVIREDAVTLFGFVDERERALFRELIGVSGVGASTARMILSSVPAAELEGVIVGGDASRLKSVKGIGAKTAQRIIVDLRDKIKPGDDTLIVQSPASSAVMDEALAALVMLGFTRQQSQKALRAIFEADPAIKVEAAIRKALAMM